MKKTEMIEIMIETYRELEPNYPQYFTKKHAEAIIARIEEKGMRPPSYWVKEGISSFHQMDWTVGLLDGSLKMKRSEMIEKLRETFRNYDNCYVIAERALYAIETAGMVPPIIEEKSWLIADPDTGEMTYAVHEWEPEVCPLIVAKIDETWRQG